MKLKVKTPKHDLEIECYSDFIEISKVKTKKKLFTDICKKGCRNFNNKYSCPPFSPKFEDYVKNYNYLFVLILKLNLNQFDYKEYHKLRVGNAVLKSKSEKIMRSLEDDRKFLSTGACRLCKPCKRKLGEKCKYPNKMRYSLESLGVDCDDLSKKLFNIPLLWYKNKKSPEYTCVLCALPLK